MDEIFEQIRQKPYAVSAASGDAALNCVVKNNELAGMLLLHGYTVRGRIGEFDWADTPLPKEIQGLASADYPATHFWLEVLRGDGTWLDVDSSVDDRLVRVGFPRCSLRSGILAFPVHTIYTSAQQSDYMQQWSNGVAVEAYYQESKAFLKATNAWLKGLKA